MRPAGNVRAAIMPGHRPLTGARPWLPVARRLSSHPSSSPALVSGLPHIPPSSGGASVSGAPLPLHFGWQWLPRVSKCPFGITATNIFAAVGFPNEPGPPPPAFGDTFTSAPLRRLKAICPRQPASCPVRGRPWCMGCRLQTSLDGSRESVHAAEDLFGLQQVCG